MPAPHRRGEAAAALAAAALIAQLLAAQLTLAIAVCLVVTGKLTRWRPAWLGVPAGAALAWALAIGPGRAGAGYTAAAVQLAHQISGPGGVGRLLTRPGAMLGGWARWLPGQLPLALLAAAAESALTSMPDWRTGEFRPGLVAAARAGYVSWTLRRGELASPDGATLGVRRGTGSRLAVSWAQARHGVLLAGQDAAALAETGYAVTAAAIQARKTVIVIDLTGDASLATAITRAASAAAAPVRRFGPAGGRYDPLAGADPDRAASLARSMIDWRGVSGRQRQLGAEYLTAAAACAAAWAAAQPPGGAEPAARSGLSLALLAAALRPATLRRLLEQLPGDVPGQSALRDRAARLCGQAAADAGLLEALAGPFSVLRAAALGQFMRPAGQRAAAHAGPEITLPGALRRREVIVFSLGRREHGRAAAMIARLVVADLTAVLGDRAAARAPADCLAWINGFEALEPRQLTSLTALGARAGAAVLASTTMTAAAAALGPAVGVIAVRGPVPPELRDMTALRDGTGSPPMTRTRGAPGAAGRAAAADASPDRDEGGAERRMPGPEDITIAVGRPAAAVQRGRAVPSRVASRRRPGPAAAAAGLARRAGSRAAR